MSSIRTLFDRYQVHVSIQMHPVIQSLHSSSIQMRSIQTLFNCSTSSIIRSSCSGPVHWVQLEHHSIITSNDQFRWVPSFDHYIQIQSRWIQFEHDSIIISKAQFRWAPSCDHHVKSGPGEFNSSIRTSFNHYVQRSVQMSSTIDHYSQNSLQPNPAQSFDHFEQHVQNPTPISPIIRSPHPKFNQPNSARSHPKFSPDQFHYSIIMPKALPNPMQFDHSIPIGLYSTFSMFKFTPDQFHHSIMKCDLRFGSAQSFDRYVPVRFGL